MENTLGEVKGSSEDLTGKKKSRFQILKKRLFGRKKRKDSQGVMKQSQSISDVTGPEGVSRENNVEDEFVYSQGILGSRALSHDSIFLAELSPSALEPELVTSQGNMNSRVKALQMKLQQQNMRLGLPPPTAIPSRRTEDTGASSEDDGLPHSPPEISLQETLERGRNYKFPNAPQRHHSSLSLAGTGSEEEDQSSPQANRTSPLAVPVSSLGVDFDTPAHFKHSLDNSAARHRMSIKPRNQRVSANRRRVPSDVHRPRSESLNDLGSSLPEKEEESEHEEAARVRSYSAEVLKTGEGPPAIGFMKPLSVSKLKPLKQTNRENRKWVDGVPQQPPTEDETERCFPPKPLLHLSQTQGSSLETETLIAPSAAAKPQEPQDSVLESMLVTCPCTSQSQTSKDLVTEIIQSKNSKDLVREIIQSQNSKDSVKEISQSQNSKDSVKEISKSLNSKDLVREIIQSQNSKDSVKEISQSQNSKDLVRKIIQSQNSKDSVKEISQSQNSKDLVREIIQSQNSKDSVKEISQSQNSKDSVKENIQSQNSKDSVKEISQSQNSKDSVKEISQSQNSKDSVKEIIQSQNSKDSVKEISQSQNSKDSVKEISQSLNSKDLVREIIQSQNSKGSVKEISQSQNSKAVLKGSTDDTLQFTNSAPVSENTSSHDPPPKLKRATKSINNRDGLNRSTKDLIQALQVQPQPRQQSLVATDTGKTMPSVNTEPTTEKSSSLNQNTAATMTPVVHDSSHSEPAQRATAHSDGTGDQPSVDTFVPQKQRLGFGSFRFSILTARNHPRTGNLAGRGEQAGAKTEDSLVKKILQNYRVKDQPTLSLEEVKTKEQPSNLPSATKADERVVGKTFLSSSPQEQPAPCLQEAKAKELPQDSPSSHERKDLLRKEDVSTLGVAGDPGDKCGSSGKVTGGETDQGMEIKPDERKSMEKNRGEDRHGRSAFGVKLRATSLSLRYTSDMVRKELKSKSVVQMSFLPHDPQSSDPLIRPTDKHSVSEAKRDTRNSPVSIDDTDRGKSIAGTHTSAFVPIESPSQNSDTPTLSGSPRATSSPPPKGDKKDTRRAGSFKQGDSKIPTNPDPAPQKEAEPRVCEPTWMTLAREKSRSLQQLLTCGLPGEVTAQQTTARPETQPAPQTTAQPAPQTTALLAPQTAPQPEPQPTPMPTPQPATPLPLQERSQRAVSVGKTDRAPVEKGQVAHTNALGGTHVTVERGASCKSISKSEVKLENKTALKIHTTETTPIASSVQHKNQEDQHQKRAETISSSSSMTSRGQPSWMELAKRKSLAWSDKTMD